MNGLAIAAYATATMTCAGGLALFAFLAATYRSPMLKAYTLQLLVATAQAGLSLAGQLSFMVSGGGTAGAALLELPTLYVLAAYVYTGPRFHFAFVETPLGPWARRSFNALAVATLALAPLSLLPTDNPFVRFGPSLVALLGFLSSILYSQVAVIRAYPRLRERFYRVGVPAIVAYNLACMAAGTVNSIVSHRQMDSGGYPYGILFEPLNIVLWNVLSFAWVLKAHGSGFFASKAGPGLDPAKAAAARLSARETDLVRLVAEGKSNKEIAAELGISANTARNHLSSVFQKTGATNRVELVRGLWSDGSR